MVDLANSWLIIKTIGHLALAKWLINSIDRDKKCNHYFSLRFFNVLEFEHKVHESSPCAQS